MKISINFILSITLFFLLASCSKKEAEKKIITNEKPETDEVILNEVQFKTAGIETGQIELRDLNTLVKVNGKLDVPPQNMVSVSAPLGGFVKNTELLQGMKVKKGQTLVVMEDPAYIQLQQDYLDAKSQSVFLEAEYKRQEELARENVTAAKTFQQTQANYKTTQSKLEALTAKLKLIYINPQSLENGTIQATISIPSPLDGYITQIHINRGSYVNPTNVMMQIVDTEHLHAEAEVFEKDIFKIKIGQRVIIRLSNEQVDREAKVFLIGKEITPERTVRIHCHLEKEDFSLLPGMYFSGVIETSDQKLFSLPEEAFVSFEGVNYAFVVLDESKHRFRMMPVTKGNCENGFCEINLPQGVDSKSGFVTKGTFDLMGLLKNTEE
jgi:cobalt-zinc-cadmium efflux system membrane fusion protein